MKQNQYVIKIQVMNGLHHTMVLMLLLVFFILDRENKCIFLADSHLQQVINDFMKVHCML